MLAGELNKNISYTKNGALAIHEILNEFSMTINHVFDKIKYVQGIANKTNLLAINASIETIHASDLLASFEHIVTNNLYIQARIIAQILEYDPDFIYQDGTEFAKECGLEEFFITDDQGIVMFTNLPAWKNASLGSSDILRILQNPDLEICLPASGNGMDSELYKVVGIGRKDQQGIIQIGSRFIKPKGQLAIDGFGVVAQEAKRLADVSKEISFRITALTNETGDKIAELNQLSTAVKESISKNVEITENDMIGEDERKGVDEPILFMKAKLIELNTSLINIRSSFKGILSPLTELINLARQTNLLGVRAAIEAAHSTNDKQDFDDLLNKHMTIEAKLASILVERRPEMTCDDMVELVESCGIGELWVSDENAVVELTNVPGGKGFIYLNEGQTAPYMRLLGDSNLVVTAPPAVRALDNKVFKYVGVGRRGKPGIFQIGNASKLYGESTAEGFAVVSKQIKFLAEQSRTITTEIENMVEGMDYKAIEAIDQLKTIFRQF